MTGTRVDDPQAWPVQRTAYARARLDWRGRPDEIITEEALYDLTGEHLKQEAADRAKSEQLLHQGVLGALNGQRYEETRRHLGVISGGREAEFEPALKAGHASVLKEFRVDELTAVRPLYEVFAESMQLTQVQKLHEGDALDAFTVYAKSDQAGRMRILSGIALLAREDSVDVTDFFERFGDSWFKGNLEIHGGLTANRMRRNREALDQLLKEGVLPADIPRGGVPDLEGILFGEGGDWQDRYYRLANWRSEVLLPGEDEGGENIVQRRMTAEERAVLEQQRDQIEGISKFFSDAQASGIRIKHDAETLEHRGLLDTLGDAAVMMGGSLPEMTMAAVSGGILLPALFTSHYERHLAALRALNPTVAEERLAPAAFGAALTDTALARFELVFAGGKLPLVRGALAKLGAAEGKLGVLTARAAAAGEKLAATGLPGRAAAAALKFTGRATAATGTEVLQNVAPEAWQAVTHALHQDIRGPDWDTVVERERAALGDTALVSIGFLVIFGGGRRAAEFMGEGKLRTLLTDWRELARQGLSPADVKIIVEKAQHSPAEAAELAKHAADTTPVEARREQILILQEQMEQEQQMGEEEQEGPLAPEEDSDLEQAPAGDPVPALVGNDPPGESPRREPFDPELVKRAVDEAVARGNKANTDEVRSLVPGYNDAPILTRDSEYYERASELNDKVAQGLLAKPAVTGRVVILAGGPGSGKTTISEDLAVESDLELDTTLSSEEFAKKLLGDIEASGRVAEIIYIHQPFAKAVELGVERYLKLKKEGRARLVPLKVAATSHIGSQETVIALAAEGVQVSVVDNSGGVGDHVEMDIGFLEKIRYIRTREGRGKNGSTDLAEAYGRGKKGDDIAGLGRVPRTDQGEIRKRAEGILVDEGRAILERYRSEGKLSSEEVEAFLK